MGGVWRMQGPCACPRCAPAPPPPRVEGQWEGCGGCGGLVLGLPARPPPPHLVCRDNGRGVADAGALCLSPSCWVATNAPHGKPTESPSPHLVCRDNGRCVAGAGAL